jgi:hypothetical protein
VKLSGKFEFAELKTANSGAPGSAASSARNWICKMVSAYVVP